MANMKKSRLPENATISVSREDWDASTTRNLSGWGWLLAFVIFLLIGYGSTDGEETTAVTPDPAVTATYAP